MVKREMLLQKGEGADGSWQVLWDSLQACAQPSGCRNCPNPKSSWTQMQERSDDITLATSHHSQYPQCNPLPLYNQSHRNVMLALPPDIYQLFYNNSFRMYAIFTGLTFRLWRHLLMSIEYSVVLQGFTGKIHKGSLIVYGQYSGYRCPWYQTDS